MTVKFGTRDDDDAAANVLFETSDNTARVLLEELDLIAADAPDDTPLTGRLDATDLLERVVTRVRHPGTEGTALARNLTALRDVAQTARRDGRRFVTWEPAQLPG